MRKLYHFEIGLPRGLESNLKKIGIVELEYLHHARLAALSDRYGKIDLPNTINCTIAKAIEVEVIDNRVNKIVWRTRYNDRFDLVIVMNMDCTVRTVWLNTVNDRHKTLDRTKYDKPE
jgi:hypothetical protein